MARTHKVRVHAAAVVALLTSAAAVAGPPTTRPTTQPAPPHQSPRDLVDALHAAFGDHHSRAVHAKGVILEGTFAAAPEAAALCKEPIFAAGANRPVLSRLSDFTGIPDIPDNDANASPRGFAFKVTGDADDEVDIVAHSFNGFPVPNGDEFGALLHAIAASGPDAPHPTPIEQYLGTHPAAKAFLTTQKTPASFATAAYFGVNALKFTGADGRSSFVRYQFIPRAGEHTLTPAEPKAKGPNFLMEEIARRAADGPVAFDWYAQLAEPGDKIDDPTIAWPNSRRRVKLGTLTLTRLVADQASANKSTLFLPGESHPGIEPADPMLTLRDCAYPISFRHRQ